MKFRRIPVWVDATQWHQVGDSAAVGYYRHPRGDSQQKCKHCKTTMHGHGWIDTLEGGHIVCPGDWIITGVAGEVYPCKPDIFERLYERVA